MDSDYLETYSSVVFPKGYWNRVTRIWADLEVMCLSNKIHILRSYIFKVLPLLGLSDWAKEKQVLW